MEIDGAAGKDGHEGEVTVHQRMMEVGEGADGEEDIRWKRQRWREVQVLWEEARAGATPGTVGWAGPGECHQVQLKIQIEYRVKLGAIDG